MCVESVQVWPSLIQSAQTKSYDHSRNGNQCREKAPVAIAHTILAVTRMDSRELEEMVSRKFRLNFRNSTLKDKGEVRASPRA